MKKMQRNINKSPKVTIITVVYNGEQYLENTIQSVVGQTFEDKEYIIIDGASTDGTVDIIKKYQEKIDYWVSEKDNGIYDAMNKGIDLANGKWINFMNAGDSFYDSNVLFNVFQKNTYENYTILYGDVEIVYEKYKKRKKAGDIADIAKAMQFSHQSVFVKGIYHKKNKFNLNNKIGADFEFFYTALYRNNIKSYYLKKIIARVSAGGLSDIKRVESIYGRWKTVGFNRMNLNIFYFATIFKEIIKKVIKSIIGKKITGYIGNKLK